VGDLILAAGDPAKVDELEGRRERKDLIPNSRERSSSSVCFAEQPANGVSVHADFQPRVTAFFRDLQCTKDGELLVAGGT
jgi:hypothetical protein